MPSRRLPNSIPSVLRTLRTAREQYKNTPDALERAISPEQFVKLADTGEPPSLLMRFEKECSDVDLALASQGAMTGDFSQKAARLGMFVSHFHQVFDFAVSRGEFPAAARRYYGRDISAAGLPPLGTYDAVEEAAEAIVKGEADRAAAEGAAHLAMANPSAAAVATALGAFRTARTAAQAAMANTDKQREEAGAMYPEAQEFAVDVCDTVEFFYRKDPSASSRRAKCRRWGVVYFFGQGETPDAPPGPGGGGGNPPPG